MYTDYNNDRFYGIDTPINKAYSVCADTCLDINEPKCQLSVAALESIGELCPPELRKSTHVIVYPWAPQYSFQLHTVSSRLVDHYQCKYYVYYEFNVCARLTATPHMRVSVSTNLADRLKGGKLGQKLELAQPDCFESAWRSVLDHIALNNMRPVRRRWRDVLRGAFRPSEAPNGI
jgi:hypothetical protein